MSRVFVDQVASRVCWLFSRCILLIVPTICYVLINGLDVHPKCVLSYNIVDDHFLDRSCIIFLGSRGHRFPGSRASKSCDIQVAEGSRDESHVGSVICSHSHMMLKLWVCSRDWGVQVLLATLTSIWWIYSLHFTAITSNAPMVLSLTTGECISA